MDFDTYYLKLSKAEDKGKFEKRFFEIRKFIFHIEVFPSTSINFTNIQRSRQVWIIFPQKYIDERSFFHYQNRLMKM